MPASGVGSTAGRREFMLLTRTFAHRRATLLGLAGALALCMFLVAPEGQVVAGSLLLLCRGTSVKAIPSDMAHIKNAYHTLYELEDIGALQGSVPKDLGDVGSVAEAASVSKLSLAV